MYHNTSKDWRETQGGNVIRPFCVGHLFVSSEKKRFRWETIDENDKIILIKEQNKSAFKINALLQQLNFVEELNTCNIYL